MGVRESVSAAAKRLPWWGSALLGAVVMTVLAAPVTVGFGQDGGSYSGWYTTAEGQLHTGLILDQTQYLRLVDATSNEAPSSEIAPFTSRSLAPWLAGRLPMDAHTALTLVNMSILVMGTFALARLAMDLTRRRDAVVLAVAIWSIAFPVFRYTGDAFVDAAAVGLIPVVLLLLWRRWILAAMAVFFAAVWMKETALMLAAVGIAFAWSDTGANATRKWVHSAAWMVVAGFAYLSAGLPGGDHLVVFAPWVPESFTTVRTTLAFNLLLPGRLLAFGLTLAPAALGAVLWWRNRRSDSPVLEEPDAVPLVVGCIAGALVALSALPTALLDGRSAWTTLPFAALLLAGAWASRESTTTSADARSLARGLRWPVLGVAVVWLAFAILVPLPGASNALEDDYRPRFAGQPDQPEDGKWDRLSGRGPATVQVARDGPVLIRFEGDAPIGLSSGDIELVAPGRVERGMTMFDPLPDSEGGEHSLDIDTESSWSLEIRPMSSALYFALSPLSGTGPNVVVYPGGLARAMVLDWHAEDPAGRVTLVGGCELGTCGELGPDGIVPAGTEAIVVDASGEWHMSPSEWTGDDEQPVLVETDATLRPTT